MQPRVTRLLATAAFALVTFGRVASAQDHGAAMAAPVPVPGEPGAYVISTGTGTRVIHAATKNASVTPDVTVTAQNFIFDADGNLATQIDEIDITAGQTVRWHFVNGLLGHTVTNGTGAADPTAGTIFDALLTSTAPDFDFTFTTAGTYPYFCSFHELSNMKGLVVVSAPTAVPGAVAAARIGFARPPAPNPARGEVAFAVTTPRDVEATVEVIDAAGRRVASVLRGTLTAGEHSLSWNGVAADGRLAAPGVYRVRLAAGGASASRTFTLLR